MKTYRNFYLKIFNFLVVKFSVYLNRLVFVMKRAKRKVKEPLCKPSIITAIEPRTKIWKQ